MTPHPSSQLAMEISQETKEDLQFTASIAVTELREKLFESETSYRFEIGSSKMMIRRAPDDTLWYGDLAKGEEYLREHIDNLPQSGHLIFHSSGLVEYVNESNEKNEYHCGVEAIRKLRAKTLKAFNKKNEIVASHHKTTKDS